MLGYVLMGGMLVVDCLVELFFDDRVVFFYGYIFGGYFVVVVVVLVNLEVMEREDLFGNVWCNENLFALELELLWDIFIVGDVWGVGYFRVVELVKD